MDPVFRASLKLQLSSSNRRRVGEMGMGDKGEDACNYQNEILKCSCRLPTTARGI